jgi:hypothetical protein
MHIHFNRKTFLCWIFLMGAGLIHAADIAKPKGAVVLSVTGNISNVNGPQKAEFDAAVLDQLALTEIETTSPWHKQKTKFSGPSLKTLLEVVGAQGKSLKMIALDKYEINVPVEDAIKFQPVLARKINGKELVVRTKGPLLMMYPFDSKSELRNDIYYSRSIWQLRRIVVE